MKLFKFVVVLLIVFESAWAASPEAFLSKIKVEGAYVRELPPTVKNTSAYMTLINSSNETVELTGAKSDIAASIMIHRTQHEDSMMSMHHMNSLHIPAHGELVLEPGGTHLMIMGLKAPIKEGTSIDLVLLFGDGAEYPLSLPVRSVLSE